MNIRIPLIDRTTRFDAAAPSETVSRLAGTGAGGPWA